jgi:hypothetical protein
VFQVLGTGELPTLNGKSNKTRTADSDFLAGNHGGIIDFKYQNNFAVHSEAPKRRVQAESERVS